MINLISKVIFLVSNILQRLYSKKKKINNQAKDNQKFAIRFSLSTKAPLRSPNFRVHQIFAIQLSPSTKTPLKSPNFRVHQIFAIRLSLSKKAPLKSLNFRVHQIFAIQLSPSMKAPLKSPNFTAVIVHPKFSHQYSSSAIIIAKLPNLRVVTKL